MVRPFKQSCFLMELINVLILCFCCSISLLLSFSVYYFLVRGVFVDQILACEILAFAAKKMNIYLYVKEHPRGSKAEYTKAYDSYERLLNYDNVKFLSNDMNTYELVDNSICVSTITGSSGWEALLRKKPVLMFGTRFYEACYGAFSVSSVEDVEEALSKILSGKIQMI